MAPSTPSFSPWVSAMRATVKSAILIQTVPIAALESWELPTCKLSAISGYLSEERDEDAIRDAQSWALGYFRCLTFKIRPLNTCL